MGDGAAAKNRRKFIIKKTLEGQKKSSKGSHAGFTGTNQP
jgi:hypothetical protein